MSRFEFLSKILTTIWNFCKMHNKQPSWCNDFILDHLITTQTLFIIASFGHTQMWHCQDLNSHQATYSYSSFCTMYNKQPSQCNDLNLDHILITNLIPHRHHLGVHYMLQCQDSDPHQDTYNYSNFCICRDMFIWRTK